MGNQSRWLDPSWQQRGVDALRADFDVSAQLKREMIEFLFETGLYKTDSLKFDAAVTRFNGCLNPGSQYMFKLSEVRALSRHFERFESLKLWADDTGHQPLCRVPTEARIAALLERIATALETNKGLVNDAFRDLSALGFKMPVHVHPAIQSGEGSFDLSEGF